MFRKGARKAMTEKILQFKSKKRYTRKHWYAINIVDDRVFFTGDSKDGEQDYISIPKVDVLKILSAYFKELNHE